MGLARWLQDVLGGAAAPELPSADEVATLVPPDADYVTAGLFEVVSDASGLVGPRPGRAPRRLAVGLTPPAETLPARGLLVLAGSTVSLLRPDGRSWSAEVSTLTGVVATRPSGFVLLSAEDADLVASMQIPVRPPPDRAWRTVPRVTTVFGGWDRELRRFGTPVYA